MSSSEQKNRRAKTFILPYFESFWWFLCFGQSIFHHINCAGAERRRLLFRNRTLKRPSVRASTKFPIFVRDILRGAHFTGARLFDRLDFRVLISDSRKSRFANEGRIDRDPVLGPFWRHFLAPKAPNFQRRFCCEAAKLAPEASICSTDFAANQKIDGPFEVVLWLRTRRRNPCPAGPI